MSLDLYDDSKSEPKKHTTKPTIKSTANVPSSQHKLVETEEGNNKIDRHGKLFKSLAHTKTQIQNEQNS